MKVNFTKMHSLGNDFLLVENFNNHLDGIAEHVARLANRNTGIGFDQLLMVESATGPHIDFFYRIYNYDGSEVAQCGNGARCFADYIYRKKLSDKKTIILGTASGLLEVTREEGHNYIVNMGEPKFSPGQIPFNAKTTEKYYLLSMEGDQIEISTISIGNPHCVIRVVEVSRAPVTTLGMQIAQHSDFPEGVNVNFVQIIDSTHIKLRVHERGVGETLACGSGACAAAIVGMLRKWCSHEVTVSFALGDVIVSWQGEGHAAFLRGPATYVYEGSFTL